MRFPFAFATSYRLPALVLGITPRTAYVELTETELPEAQLHVRFGLWRMRTELTNVAGAETTGDFAYLKTAGPPHLSFTDRGVTFATNGEAAVCVRFHEPVRVLDPTGRVRHPAATMTVADPDAFLAALTR